MGWIFIAVLTPQATDHANRDLTVARQTLLEGLHTNVRTLTVTAQGELRGKPGAEVRAEAIVVDGTVSGGTLPVILAGGSLEAGRSPALLAPADGAVLPTFPTFAWYPSSRAAELRYELVIQGPGATTLSLPDLTATSAGPLELPDGLYSWKVVSESVLGTYAGEEWTFLLVGKGPPGGPPLTEPPPAGDIIVELPFDGPDDATSWTLTGTDPQVGWSIDGTPGEAPGGPAHSAPYSLNYNNGVDYVTPGEPNRGTAQGPFLDLGGLTLPELRFWCNYDTRDPGLELDQRWVRVLDAQGVLRVEEQLSMIPDRSLAGPCREPGTWHEHVLPLDPSWGSVVAEFEFDTVDAVDVSLAGWFVDDLRLAAALAPSPDVPPPPAGSPPSSVGGKSKKKRPSLFRSCAAGTGMPAWAGLALAAAIVASRRLGRRPPP